MPHDPFYVSAAWRLVRAKVLAANPVCIVPGCLAGARHVDHLVARGRGGAPLDPSNLQALCHSHHSVKTATSDGGFGRTGRAPVKLVAKGCNADGSPRDPGHHWPPRAIGNV